MAELIARRYGQALFNLAFEAGELAEREQEIESVLAAFEEDDELIHILNHPKLSKGERIKLIESIFVSKVSDDLVGFFVLAIQKGRQENIVEILEYALSKMEEYNGFLTAHVISAVELTEEDKQAIISKLETQTKQKITLETSVDKSLIGGIIIRINDRIVDNTVKGTLHRMARDVYDAKV